MMRRMPMRWTYEMDVRLLGANDPASKAAKTIQDDFPSDTLRPFRGFMLGNVAVDEAFIYPPVPMKLTPTDAVNRMLDLVQREGEKRSSLVTLCDGSTFEAIPVGLDITSGGPMNLTFHDLTTNSSRVLAAQEVAGID
jgi:hypothetical protein